MTVGLAAGGQISRRLQESLARLRKDIDRVELWAGALESFSQPIPEYQPTRDYELPEDSDPESASEQTVYKTDAVTISPLSKPLSRRT